MSGIDGEPEWLDVETVRQFHVEQLRLFGGAEGTRDEGLLLSALARPVNAWHYGETDLVNLAASYAFGISRNHPFFDGNKRTAFTALLVFLGLNGTRISPDISETIMVMLSLAAGEIDESGLADWIRRAIGHNTP